jgi:glycosyltransferase involved in cell wall biosynthesis
MKISLFVHCFFPDHFYGTETYTFNLARCYQALGHEVTVVSAIFQGEPSAGKLLSRYEYQGIHVVCIDKNLLPHSRVKETYYQPDMRGVLEKVLHELRPDIVHVTHLINHTSALLEVVGQLGIPTFATFTDFFGFCLNNKLEAANGDLCAGPSSSRANCLACHLKDAARNPIAEPWIRRASSSGMAQLIAGGAILARRMPGLRNGPIDRLVEDIARRPETLSQLYNSNYKAAVAPTRFLKNAYLANDIRVPLHNIWFGIDIDRRLKPKRLTGHIPVIGFIGQIAPHKGTDILIEAFQRLTLKSAELRIYGPTDQDPSYMDNLRAMADGNNIQFMGTFEKERMADVLGEIDLLVIPSRWYENSPLVLLNALATHTPVLASDVEGMTEFVTNGVNGTSFQRGSVDDMEEKLRALLKNPEMLAAMSSTTNYDRTPEVMASETLNVYSA